MVKSLELAGVKVTITDDAKKLAEENENVANQSQQDAIKAQKECNKEVNLKQAKIICLQSEIEDVKKVTENRIANLKKLASNCVEAKKTVLENAAYFTF